MAVQDYQLLLKVGADMQEALDGLKSLSGSLGTAKTNTDQLGESADEATARIKAMVAATSEQVQIQESARSQAERAAQTANATIKSYDDQAAAQQRATKAAQDYRNAASGTGTSAIGGNAAVAGLQAEQAAMAKLAGQIDPTVAALAKLDAQEAALNALRSKGAVGVEDYTAFKAVIDQNRVALTGAAGAAEQFAFSSASAKREYGVLAGELARGNTARLEGSLVTLANKTGFLTALFSPLGLAILAATGVVAGFALIVEKGVEEENALNNALIATNNYAGVSVSTLQQVGQSVGVATGQYTKANTAVLALANSGKFSGDSLATAAQAAVAMSQVTGESIDKAVASIIRLQDEPVSAIKALNDQYHFLSAATYEQITALEAEGETEKAAALAQQTFADAIEQRREDEVKNLGFVESAWNAITAAVSGAIQRVKEFGSSSTNSQLDNYYAQRGSVADTASENAYQYVDGQAFKGKQAALDYIDQQIGKLKELKTAQDATAKTQSDQDKENQQGIAAVDRLDALAKGYDKVHDQQLIVKKLNDDLMKQWTTTSTLPAGVDMTGNADAPFDGVGFDYLKKKALGESVKPAKPKSTVGVDNAAATAQAELIKQLNDEQGAVDPVAKIWSTYNDTVAKATQLAATAVKGKGANVQAIDAERDAVIAVAASVRDAALDKQADKDRVAFEKLRDSLSGLKSLSFSEMNKQLDDLNKLFKAGAANAQEYSDTAAKILDQNVPKLPEFKGADALTTGPFGELDKLDDQTKQLQDVYTKQLAVLNDWHDKQLTANKDSQALMLDADNQFVAKENALFADRNKQQQQIDDARQTVMLAGITSSLDQAASAIKVGFGEQSEAYRVAFAISKAAAIAQGTVALYQAILKAEGSLPYPANIAAMAAVGAQGAALLSQIASVNAGFDKGGYTGDGAKLQPAGIVHAGEFVNRSEVVSQPGAMAFLEDFNQRGMAAVYARTIPGYSDGGLVNSPVSSTERFTAPAMNDFKMPTSAPGAGNNGNSGARIRIVNTVDSSVMKDWASSSEGEQVILNTLTRNRTTLKTLVSH